MSESSKLHIEHTTDHCRIEKLMRHPAIRPFITDDSAEFDGAALEEAMKLGLLFGLLVKNEAGEVLGAFLLARHEDMVSLHTMLLPSCRGRRAKEACERLREWILANTYIETLFTHYYSNRPHVGRFAASYGFREDGNEKDVTIGGKSATMRRMVLQLNR